MKSTKFLAAAAITVALVSAGCKQLTKDDIADAYKEALTSHAQQMEQQDTLERAREQGVRRLRSSLSSLFDTDAAETEMVTAAEIKEKVAEFNKEQKENAIHTKFSKPQPYCEATYNGKDQKKKMNLYDNKVLKEFAENFDIVVKMM